jgi:hypothetical protein
MSEPIITQARLNELRALMEDQHTETTGVRIVTMRALLNLIAKQREALADINALECTNTCGGFRCSDMSEKARAALALVKE